MSRRVVITGIGLVSSLGIGTSANWSALLAGTSGVARITKFDASGFAAQIAAEVRGFDPLQFVDKKDVKKMDVFIQYAIAASQFAMDDSGLADHARERPVDRRLHRVGHRRVRHDRARARGAARGRAAQDLALLHSLGHHQPRCRPGVDPVRRQGAEPGDVHRVLRVRARHRRVVRDHPARRRRRDDRGRLGSGDYADERRRVRRACSALSTRNDDPARASRPFDKDRDGFIIGEGAGVLILEELEHARRRGAPHLRRARRLRRRPPTRTTSPRRPRTARAPSASWGWPCKKAGIRPEQVDYINAHGTSTPYNDRLETLAIKKCFGDHARKVAISSTKSMTGHLLGARRRARGRHRGAVRAPPGGAADDQPRRPRSRVRPRLRAAQEPRAARFEYALSNSFGFGGTNAALLFKRYEGVNRNHDDTKASKLTTSVFRSS